MDMNTVLLKFYETTIFEVVKAGGKLVDYETFEKRSEVCAGCPYFGTVKPIPLISAPGCTICKCPLQTKGKMQTILTTSGFKQIECPHPDGNKWNFNLTTT